MAIDPRIAMGAQAPNLQTSIKLFQDTLNNIQGRKMNEQAMAQNAVMDPLRAKEAQQVVDMNQTSIDTASENKVIQSLVDFEPTLRPFLENGDNMGGLQALQARKQDLQSRGVDTTQTDEAIQEILNGNPDNVLQSLNTVKQEAVNRGLVGGAANMTAGQRERQSLLMDAQSDDPVVRNSALVALGQKARAGDSAQERIARDPSTTKAVASSQAQIEGEKESAKETAKLTAQLKLQPQVESAVKSAVLLAQNEADRAGTTRSNKRALEVYNVGMRGLTSAMDEAYTGTFAGLMPALTQKSRVADGAIAAMAPVLKAMFRSSGEGAFTDKDQELLVAMIPTRRDDEESRAAKLRNIDTIVRAKLAPTESIAETPTPSPESNNITMDDLLNMTPEELDAVPIEVLKRLGGQ